jgi:beta-lactamase class A
MRGAALLLIATGCGTLPHPDLAPTLRALAARGEGKTIAIAYRDLRTGFAASVHGDVILHAASTMKVPVMIEVFRAADAGRLDLEQPVQLANSFASIVDGSPYALDPADDSDAEPYAHLGERWPLRRLVHAMIVRSSNLATNLVIALADPHAVQVTCEALGTRSMQVRRGVEDGKAFAAGLNNVTTADDLATLMVALANDTAASPESCAEMRAILAAQEFNDLIPAGLPPGTRVAHKTGEITAHQHDAAIVVPQAGSPYVLVVLTKGWADAKESATVIADVARAVHAGRQAR